MARSLSSYNRAVYTLNSLQSNAAVIAQIRKDRELHPDRNVRETATFLQSAGYPVSALDRLQIIHVAGTKGKGSTCAFTEAILRRHGLRTGFYSSPHLLDVRERIRINGRPISEELFAQYFWRVYNSLQEHHGDDMPAYFKFMTVLSFVVFLEEKVDVALVEVGIGGAFDCTNVIQRPAVCGITTLDYDHMSILGNSIQEIAWNKAGILKEGVVGLTVGQAPEALCVLAERGRELGAELALVPPLPDYAPLSALPAGIPGPQQHSNLSLAFQLARYWLAAHQGIPSLDVSKKVEVLNPKSSEVVQIPIVPAFSPSSLYKDAIRVYSLWECTWAGRSQIVDVGRRRFFLDGAHTPKSILYCAEWFASEMERGRKGERVLIFHCTADRDPATLLSALVSLGWDRVIFCPPFANSKLDPASSQANFMLSRDKQLERCVENAGVWAGLSGGVSERAACVEDALSSLPEEASVLVTGSLHLVGGVLGFLAPHSP